MISKKDCVNVKFVVLNGRNGLTSKLKKIVNKSEWTIILCLVSVLLHFGSCGVCLLYTANALSSVLEF